ncbi:SdpI family protein [Saccharothrix xinjiangensis]|uniref:SdpI family protein n=1 Tax=Saccharothrix xinjiangensis TaxID=204798 RepID=A0ABV9Y0A7_9PSEU
MSLVQFLGTTAQQQQPEQVPGLAMVVLFAVQGVAALCLFLMAYLGANEKLPRNAFFGLRTDQSRADDATWRHVHRVAAPFAYAAGAAAIAGLGALALTTDRAALFLASLLITNVVVVVFIGLAMTHGHRNLPVG